MNNVIALTNDNRTFTDLFYYSTLYGYRFKITGSTEEALAYFVQQRTSLFVVDCSDTEQRFLKFARQLAPGLAVMAICGGARSCRNGNMWRGGGRRTCHTGF